MKAIYRLLPLMLALAACKTTPRADTASAGSESETAVSPTAAAAEIPVEQRAVKRWELLVAGKPEDAYEYLTPGYRQTRNKEDYTQLILNRPIQWTGVSYLDKLCESADACSVKVKIKFKLDSPIPGVGVIHSENPQQEQWIRSDGQWYFLPSVAPAVKGLR